MTKKKLLPYFLLSGALLLVLLIYLAPKVPKTESQVVPELTSSSTIEEIIDREKKDLPDSTLTKITFLEQDVAASPHPDSTYRFLSELWLKHQKPGIAAFYNERLAQLMQSADEYVTAGDIYLQASNAIQENDESNYWMERAGAAFEEANRMNPGDPAIMTRLGTYYTEATQEPMKGITLLREVLNKNPDFVDAHLQLGLFSIKSGQYDKAIERFNFVINSDTSKIDAYLYLAESYRFMQKKDSAIIFAKKFKEANADPMMERQVDFYIKELQSN